MFERQIKYVRSFVVYVRKSGQYVKKADQICSMYRNFRSDQCMFEVKCVTIYLKRKYKNEIEIFIHFQQTNNNISALQMPLFQRG